MSGDTGSFLVNVTGQLEWLDLPNALGNMIHCRIEIVSGPDWTVVRGVEAIVSQIAESHNSKYVLNLPIDILFKSTNPSGWPQIIISSFSGERPVGYGRIHVPLQPGVKPLSVPLSCPLSSTFLGNILAGVLTRYPELQDARVLADGPPTHAMKMQSCGYASLSLNCVTRGMKTLGYDVASS